MRGIYIGSLFVVGALAAGCGSVTSATASLAITSPTSNSTVNVGAGDMIAVNFSTNYTLRTPGQCTGITDCGHVWILVDSNACDQKSPAESYNALAVSSPVDANLSLCAMVPGAHTITAVLHDDLDNPVKDVLGDPATSSVTITVP